MQSMDIPPEMLMRILGAPKDSMEAHGPSEDFFVKQRARATSHAVSAVSPISKSSSKRKGRQLSLEEVQAMFTGAPQFNVSKQKNIFRPQVIFRGGDAEDAAKYGRDYAQLGHSTFDAATLGLHRTREVSGQASRGLAPHRDASKDHPIEVPSMISAQGVDPGTTGFEYFLQMPIADSATAHEEANLLEKRKLLYSNPEKLGLRALNIEVVIDKLSELSDLSQTRKEQGTDSETPNDQKISEMHVDLFAKLLCLPDDDVLAEPDSTGLKAQIVTLIKVLNTSELWHDFSMVEWRIRVGQLLWASVDRENSLDEDREPSERDILLLQISLAAELLIRLDIVQSLSSSQDYPPLVTEADIEQIQAFRTPKVGWDLVLAQQFLENLHISAKIPKEPSKEDNRSSFFSAISFFTANESPEDGNFVQPLLFPKNEAQQLAGLLCFAEAIEWPHAQDVRSELESKLCPPTQRPVSRVLSIYSTPLGTPGFGPNKRSSYFGMPQKPPMNRMATTQSMQLLPAAIYDSNSDSFEVGGWLSRSWLTGLVLPGEAASHFLISTLLENSPQAIEALGDSANLYGGFIYQGRSFWSKHCVVGRVLAATKGAADCMGWVSAPDFTGNQDDGWVNLDVHEVNTPPSARITADAVVAKDSDVLHGTEASAALSSDFTWPVDGPPVLGNEVISHGLSFTDSSTTFELTMSDAGRPPVQHGDSGVGAMATSQANLTFSSPLNSKLARLQVPLTHDVHFVSSYPCYPSPRPKAKRAAHASLRTASADSEAQGLSSLQSAPMSSGSSLDKDLPAPPAHPLHVGYHYEIVPVATLLSSSPDPLASATERAAQGNQEAMSEEVLVLDCRGTEDLEVLARAWCAKVGENAIIGRSGRTCVACCVREARALDVRIVIRT